jgi:hypothetical protein
MMTLNTPNPVANRFDNQGDEIARHFFSEDDLQMSPEEYAARQAHNWACFSAHRYHYQDAALGAWVRRLGEILFDPEELERCRQRFLTPEELADVRRRAAAEF